MKYLTTFILLFALVAESATYYVDGVGGSGLDAGGSNGNDGSLATPWLTLAYAVSQMSAGDTILVRGGSYTNERPTWVSGSSDSARCVIKNYPNETPTFVWQNAGYLGGHWSFDNPDYITLSGLTLNAKGSDTDPTDGNPVIKITQGGAGVNSSYIVITNCYVEGGSSHCILISDSGNPQLLVGTIIENNVLTQPGQDKTGTSSPPHPIYISGSGANGPGAVIVRGNEISWATNNIAGNCYAIHNYSGTQGSHIWENNWIHDCENGPLIGSTIVGGGAIMRNNLIHDISELGFKVQYGDPSTNKIINNTIIATLYGVQDVTGTTIYVNNIISGNGGAGYAFRYESGTADVYMTNNIAYGYSSEAYSDGAVGSIIQSGNLSGTSPVYELYEAGRGYYRLSHTDTIAKSAGINTSDWGVTTDLLGQARTGTYEIGALELVGARVFIDDGGNDSNAGTYSSPWRTIQKGVGQFNLASTPKTNTLIVMAGTYNGSNDRFHQDDFGDFGNDANDQVYIIGEGASTVWETGNRPYIVPNSPASTTRVWEFGQNRPAGHHYVTASNLWLCATNLNAATPVVKLDYQAHHHSFYNCEFSGSADNMGVLISENGLWDTYHHFEDCFAHDNGWDAVGGSPCHNFYVHTSHNTFFNIKSYRTEEHDFHFFTGSADAAFNVVSNAWLMGNTGIGNRSGSISNKVYNILWTPRNHITTADNPKYGNGYLALRDSGSGGYNEYYNVTADGWGTGVSAGASITTDNNILKNIFVLHSTNAVDQAITFSSTADNNLLDGYVSLTNRLGNTVVNNGTGNTIQNGITTGDAGFVSWTAGSLAFLDYRLTTNSVAYNAGVTVASLNEDIIGVSRPQGASFDIGAFEYDLGELDGGTPPELPPDPPTSLVATADSQTQITLTWADNDDDPQETSFRIERSLTGGGAGFSEIDSVATDVLTYVDTGRSAGTTYYYRIRARNAAGDSAYTSEASDTTPAASGTRSPGKSEYGHSRGKGNR